MAPSLLFTIVVVALCYPAWLSFGDVVIGHPRSDVWKHLWGDAWFQQALGSEWPVPLHTTKVGYPDGGLLYNLDPITGVFCTLLGFLPLVWVHNLVQSASLVAGALGAVALAQRWVEHRPSAWISGAVYGFSGHLQAVALASGISETAHIAGFPWSIWILLKVLDGRKHRSIPLLGLVLAWSALGSWYYGLVTSMGCLLVLSAWCVEENRQGSIPREPLKIAVLGGLLGIVLTLPFAESFLQSMRSEQGLHWVGSVGLAASDLNPEQNYAVATLSDFFSTGARVQDKVDLLFFSNHPGFMPMGLAIMGLVLFPRPGVGLVLGALVSALLCMGPEIYLNRAESLGPNPVFLLFQTVWPGFDLVQNLERMQVGLSLCVGLLAALGLGGLIRLWKPNTRIQRAVGVTAVALVVMEANWGTGLGFPLPTASAKISPLYDELLEQEGAFGIIELPVDHGGSGKPYWNQVRHGRPLPLSLDGNPSPSLHSNPLMAEFLPGQRYNRFFLSLRSDEPSLEDLMQAKQELFELGFHYVVLRDTKEAPQDRLRRLLDQLCGYPKQADHDEGLSLYSLK